MDFVSLGFIGTAPVPVSRESGIREGAGNGVASPPDDDDLSDDHRRTPAFVDSRALEPHTLPAVDSREIKASGPKDANFDLWLSGHTRVRQEHLEGLDPRKLQLVHDILNGLPDLSSEARYELASNVAFKRSGEVLSAVRLILNESVLSVADLRVGMGLWLEHAELVDLRDIEIFMDLAARYMNVDLTDNRTAGYRETAVVNGKPLSRVYNFGPRVEAGIFSEMDLDLWRRFSAFDLVSTDGTDTQIALARLLRCLGVESAKVIKIVEPDRTHLRIAYDRVG